MVGAQRALADFGGLAVVGLGLAEASQPVEREAEIGRRRRDVEMVRAQHRLADRQCSAEMGLGFGIAALVEQRIAEQAVEIGCGRVVRSERAFGQRQRLARGRLALLRAVVVQQPFDRRSALCDVGGRIGAGGTGQTDDRAGQQRRAQGGEKPPDARSASPLPSLHAKLPSTRQNDTARNGDNKARCWLAAWPPAHHPAHCMRLPTRRGDHFRYRRSLVPRQQIDQHRQL